jgi:arylsulfatase A-like enzyme
MCFENAFTQCPICTPARYSLLSGRYVSNHGALTNDHGVYETVPSLVDEFNRNGYHTLAVGKLHHNPPDQAFGFQEVLLHDGTFRDRRKYSVYSQYLAKRGIDEDDLAYAADVDEDPLKRQYKDRLHWGRCRLAEEHCESTFLAKTAIDRIENYTLEKPLFLYLSFVAPHSPYCPPAPYDTMFAPEDMPLPQRESEEQLDKKHPLLRRQVAQMERDRTQTARMSDETIRAVRAQYAGLIRHMDDHVGRVVTAVRKRFGEDVLICVTSDHGDFMGEHHKFQKHLMYDGATRVPYVVCWPGRVPAGRRVRGLVEQVDMLPTLLGLAGAERSVRRIPGRDESQGVLDGAVQGSEFVYSEHWRAIGGDGEYTAMARSDRYKLIVILDKAPERPLFYEFYDLEQDPYELDNRIDDPACSAEIERHYHALMDWQVRSKRCAPPNLNGHP